MTAKKRTRGKAVSNKKWISFECIPLLQCETQLFLFTSSAKKLWKVVDINRKIENKDEGYQRALASTRVSRIARFIEDRNILPTSVLVSFDEGKLNKEKTLLKIPNRPAAGWVIDGQHRLAGAHESKRDIILPVVAFLGLALEDQINCFVTINKEQKGVPASLYYELLKQLPKKKSDKEILQERATDIAKELKLDDTSPFAGRIVTTTSPGKGQISLANFVRKMVPLIQPKGRLALIPDEERVGILNNYYRGLSNVFPREYNNVNSIFFKTLGFGALMNALPTFLDLTIQKKHGFRVADVSETLKAIEDFDFQVWKQKGTGTAAENSAAEEFIVELTKALAPSETAILLE